MKNMKEMGKKRSRFLDGNSKRKIMHLRKGFNYSNILTLKALEKNRCRSGSQNIKQIRQNNPELRK
ncbi:hypothetical protein [Dehalobacterium formicoaceticum]|uniref:Uncharacterized protein n=1 Tax=Dehalobacterium formicoaceticum TaxID=51515 RepID=A0ABT1Y5E6_9FIRM|nr:hypothetical protein [Dehalobacterium formicoaceticum]MCR6546105.1 hypothetical protein [Dehalobacterium formicoaceticum]